MAVVGTTRQNYEQVSFRGPEGAMLTSFAREIIGDGVAARQLVAKESGALVLFDIATVTYTLPSPVIGMEFEFATLTTQTAGKVITSLTTEFLLGALSIQTIATVTPAGFAANGTTIRSVLLNGTTTGGLTGDRFKLTALNSTQWQISGMLIGSGTLVTPFSTT